MLAFMSVWISLCTLLLATTMLLYRPAFTDVTVVLVLYFGSPGALCFAGLILWAFRKEDSSDEGITSQRTQCLTAIIMALLAAAIVYILIIQSEKIIPIEAAANTFYNSQYGWG